MFESTRVLFGPTVTPEAEKAVRTRADKKEKRISAGVVGGKAVNGPYTALFIKWRPFWASQERLTINFELLTSEMH